MARAHIISKSGSSSLHLDATARSLPGAVPSSSVKTETLVYLPLDLNYFRFSLNMLAISSQRGTDRNVS